MKLSSKFAPPPRHDDFPDLKRRIWIGWERHRRNQSCSKRFQAKLFEIEVPGNQLVRYSKSFLRTLRIIRAHEFDELYCQNPSIILTVLCVALGRSRGFPVIVDAHNSALIPLSREVWTLRRFITKWWIKSAHTVIVTNKYLVRFIEEAGGNAVILPDPLPEIEFPDTPIKHDRFRNGKWNILYICSWASDEPYAEVMRAAEILESKANVFITGNYQRRHSYLQHDQLVSAVLLGYISDEEFESYLWNADIVVDLTDREDCLLCGAYEALACEKPMVLSDTTALREYFGDSAVYTDNSHQDLVAQIEYLIESYNDFKSNSKIVKASVLTRWDGILSIAQESIRARQSH